MSYASNITLVAALIGGLVGLAVGAVPYVFSSLGLYRILQNRGVPNPWMAWVPVANYYAQGAVADDINLRTRGKTTHLRHWLLFLGPVSYTHLQQSRPLSGARRTSPAPGGPCNSRR